MTRDGRVALWWEAGGSRYRCLPARLAARVEGSPRVRWRARWCPSSSWDASRLRPGEEPQNMRAEAALYQRGGWIDRGGGWHERDCGCSSCAGVGRPRAEIERGRP
jgi:hypothetical protein